MAEPEQPQESKENLAPKGEGIKPLRTLEGDIAEALGQEKTSAAQIVVAETVSREKRDSMQSAIEPYEPPHTERKRMIIIISGVVALAGLIGTGAWWYFKPKELPPPPLTSTGQTIINIDVEKTIDLTNLTYQQIVDAIARERDAATLRVNATESIAFVQRDASGATTELTTGEFLSKIAPSIPQSLVRSLEKQFAFGLIGFDGNQPFLILRTASFQSAYDGMLRGEIDFYREAGAVFVAERPLPGLSSSPDSYYGTNPDTQVFYDVVIGNIDTRAVKNVNGDIIFLYAFPDQATIVVTTNQKTFGELIEKMRRARLIR